MPNAISSTINRIVKTVFAPGEIGVGSHNFVAFVQQADGSRRFNLTGFDINVFTSDPQPFFVDLFLIENQLVTLQSPVNPSNTTIRNGKVISYSFDLRNNPVGNNLLFTDRRTHPFIFTPGVSYSFILSLSSGGPGAAPVTMELTPFGFYDVPDDPIKLKFR